MTLLPPGIIIPGMRETTTAIAALPALLESAAQAVAEDGEAIRADLERELYHAEAEMVRAAMRDRLEWLETDRGEVAS